MTEFIGNIIGVFIILFLVCLISATFVFFSWNLTLPALFGFKYITLAQAFWLSVLCNCLLKTHVNLKKD